MGIWSWLKRTLSGRTGGRSPFPPGTGPARLLVLRHAEKTGKKSDHHLSPEGQERAERLAAYIPKEFGKPDFLIAANRNKYSDRPVDTLKPLAAALGLGIIDHLEDEDAPGLVALMRDDPAFSGKLGVISWRHSDLPSLIAALGAAPGTYPDPWEEDLYALIADLQFTAGAPPIVRLITQPF